MNTRRPAILKNATRAATGGAAVVIALIALMFLKGGPGTGEDEPGATDAEGEVLASTDPDKTPDVTPNESTDPEVNSTEPEEGGLTADEKKALQDDVLEILIDEYDYFLVVPGTDTLYRPTELKRLVTLAEQTNGDSNGIRVRILRRETSRTKAEVDLKAALAGAGVGEDAVYMPEELLAP